MPIMRFGVFEVDPDSGELRKRGFRLRLREQPLRLLLTLIDHAGRVVTREQLRDRLWPGARSSTLTARSTRRSASCAPPSGTPRPVRGLLKRCQNGAIALSVRSKAVRVLYGPRRPPVSPLTRSEHASQGDISGIGGPSPICIRASDSLKTRWKSMIGARLPTRGWQTPTCCVASGGCGRLMSHSEPGGVLLHGRLNWTRTSLRRIPQWRKC